MNSRPMQPKGGRRDEHSKIAEAVQVLDGMICLGKSWNVITIKTWGRVRIVVNDIVEVKKPKKFKGIPELSAFTQILEIQLLQISEANLSLLFGTLGPPVNWNGMTTQFRQVQFYLEYTYCKKKTVDVLFAGKQLQEVRRIVKNAILSAIQKLPDFSKTKKDQCWTQDENFGIDGQNDWEDLGNHFVKSLKVSLAETHENIPQILQNSEIFFVYKRLGQEKQLGKLHVFEDSQVRKLKEELTSYFCCTRLDEVIRVVIHCATDYTLRNDDMDKLTKILFFDSEFIAKKCGLQGQKKKFYPSVVLSGVGNLTFQFPDYQSRICHLKTYQRWTNDIKKQRYKYFLQPCIAKRIFEIAYARFYPNVQKNGKETVKKPTVADTFLLNGRVTGLVREMIGILQEGVEIRIEVIWSNNRMESNMEDTLCLAFQESNAWLKMHSLSHHNQDNFIRRIDKSQVIEWAKYHLIPCIKTIDRAIDLVNASIRAKTIIEIPTSSYFSPDDFSNILAAETIISFFFFGDLHDTTVGMWSKRIKDLLGFSKMSLEMSEFVINNVTFENGFVQWMPVEGEFMAPDWITWPEILFRKEIRKQLDNTINGTFSGLRFSNAILGFALSFEKAKTLKTRNIQFKVESLDLDTMFKNSIFQLRGRTSTGKTSHLPKPILREVISVSEMLEVLMTPSKSGKTDIMYLMDLIKESLHNLGFQWELQSSLFHQIENEVISQKRPIVFFANESYLAAIPSLHSIGIKKDKLNEMVLLLKETYAWFRTYTKPYVWTTAEEIFFERVAASLQNYQENIWGYIHLNTFFKIAVLFVDGEIMLAKKEMLSAGLDINFLYD